jgi:hypothetical protein
MNRLLLTALIASASACGGATATVSSSDGGDEAGSVADSGSGADASTHPDAGSDGSAGTCETPPWSFGGGGTEPEWVTGNCPDAGCPAGTTCVHAAIASKVVPIGCAPVPASCGGNPGCGCMGCVCGNAQCVSVHPAGYSFECDTLTRSRRAVKDEIEYVDDAERSALARQALDIPLARYRYRGEAPDARRRLGFIIDDQPDPSPAVLADREHVDQYGYTSMLLAAVQEQARELAALRRRVDELEARGTCR